MKTKNKLLASGFALALVAACGLAGCGGSSDSGSASDAGSTAAEGTLTFGCQNYSGGLIDPAMEQNTAWNYTRYGIGECLFKFDDSMNVEGWLATDDYTVSDDHKTWTFNIRQDCYFSDGCQLTPTKIKESIERCWADGTSGSAPENFLEKSATITADDENWTLTIETDTAYVDLRKNLAFPVMAIVDVADTTDYDHGTIGTGPYAVADYETDVSYDLVANEYYPEEVPYQNVSLVFLGDATAKANALQSGQIDLTENVATVSDLQTLKDSADYNVDTATGVRCGFSYVNFDGILANDDLRHAVMMAIDGQTVADTTVAGLYTYGYSVLPSNLEYNYDKLNYEYSFDKDAAEKVLDDAGIVDSDGDGIRELDGENITLEWITYENRGLSDMAQAGQQQLAEIGIDVNVNVTDSDSEWALMENGEYDLCSSNWTTVGTGDPTNYLANWYGSEENEANYCNYQNDEYDAAYEQLLTEMDEDTRTELITTMQQCLLDDAAVLVHGYYNSTMISRASAISNAPIHTIDYYWLTTEITPAE